MGIGDFNHKLNRTTERYNIRLAFRIEFHIAEFISQKKQILKTSYNLFILRLNKFNFFSYLIYYFV